jgi:hypothetical protein
MEDVTRNQRTVSNGPLYLANGLLLIILAILIWIAVKPCCCVSAAVPKKAAGLVVTSPTPAVAAIIKKNETNIPAAPVVVTVRKSDRAEKPAVTKKAKPVAFAEAKPLPAVTPASQPPPPPAKVEVAKAAEPTPVKPAAPVAFAEAKPLPAVTPASQPPPPPVKPVEVAKTFVAPTPASKPTIGVVPTIAPPTFKGPEASWSVWNALLTSPVEPGNFANYSHGDFGVVIARPGKFQVEPYVGLNLTKDTKGLPWNNKSQVEAGVKLVRPFANGEVTLNGAFAAENRAGGIGIPSQGKTAVIGYTTGWFGWSQPTAQDPKKKFLTGDFPRTIQWSVGNISPFEKNNLLAYVRVEQGVTLVKAKGISLMPTGWLQGVTDKDKNPWNNRLTYGLGLGFSKPFDKGVTNITAGYECASQYRGPAPAGVNNCGVTGRLTFWTGGRKKLGREQ